MGSEGGGEGVMARTYCIQPKNNDVIVIVNDLHSIIATALTVA